jgi:hypothetical protein
LFYSYLTYLKTQRGSAMKSLTNLSILALHTHATLMEEVYGKIPHLELVAEARNLVDMGIPKDQVDKALFRVENIHNISV